MPCYDPRDDVQKVEVEVESGKQTSRLCAIFSALERMGMLTQTLDNADWKECGVSRSSTEVWWKNHKEEDARRRQREREEAKRKRERHEALMSLTPKQRKALGL